LLGLIVIAGAAGLIVVILSADPRSLGSWAVPARCTRSDPADAPCIDHLTNGSGAWLAVWGAVLAVGSGIVALLRSRGEAPTPSAAPAPAVPSNATLSTDLATPQETRMSDAALFGRTMVALLIVLAVFVFVLFMEFVSQDTI
jgi:amino acid transporter